MREALLPSTLAAKAKERSALTCVNGALGFAPGVHGDITAVVRNGGAFMDKKYLGLIGPEDSVYLRLIQREAEKALEEVE